MFRRVCVIILVLGLLCALGCGGGGGGSDSNPDDGDIVNPPEQTNPIVGGWAYVDDYGCITTFDFKEDNTFFVYSALNVLFGTYNLTKNDTAYTLGFVIVSDNRELDCEGGTSDEEGNTYSGRVAINDYVLMFLDDDMAFDRIK